MLKTGGYMKRGEVSYDFRVRWEKEFRIGLGPLKL